MPAKLFFCISEALVTSLLESMLTSLPAIRLIGPAARIFPDWSLILRLAAMVMLPSESNVLTALILASFERFSSDLATRMPIDRLPSPEEKLIPKPALQELLELDDSDVPVAALRLISPLTADGKKKSQIRTDNRDP